MKAKRKTSADVYVPEWDETVTLSRLGAEALLDISAMGEAFAKDADGNLTSTREKIKFGVELLALSIVEEGKRVFDNDEGREYLATDLPALQCVIDAALQLNGLAPDSNDMETAKN